MKKRMKQRRAKAAIEKMTLMKSRRKDELQAIVQELSMKLYEEAANRLRLSKTAELALKSR
ncbi:hypothetical protein PO124_17485 [Bacillus licheniformis]|nr:hypothetical protein [Bacillus licheniformis]